MLIKRKLYSVMDEEDNLGYYLYDESNGEEKLFSVKEDERLFARGVGAAVKAARQMAQSKGQGALNKAAKREMLGRLGDEAREILGVSKYLKRIPGTNTDVSIALGKHRISEALSHGPYPKVLTAINNKVPGNVMKNKNEIIKAARPDSILEKRDMKKYLKIR